MCGINLDEAKRVLETVSIDEIVDTADSPNNVFLVCADQDKPYVTVEEYQELLRVVQEKMEREGPSTSLNKIMREMAECARHEPHLLLEKFPAMAFHVNAGIISLDKMVSELIASEY